MKKTNNYSIIDFGNSYIKIGIYNGNKTSFYEFINTTKPKFIYDEIYKNKDIKKIYIGTTCPNRSKLLFDLLLRNKQSVRKIESEDFRDLVKVDENSKIDIPKAAPDILSFCLYLSNNYKSAVGYCLGTAFFSIFIKNSELIGAIIAPNIENSFSIINNSTELIKKVDINFDNWLGTNTEKCLGAGGRHLINGFINSIYFYAKKHYWIKNFIITGGFSKNVDFIENKSKYKFEENVIIKGYKILIDKKGL